MSDDYTPSTDEMADAYTQMRTREAKGETPGERILTAIDALSEFERGMATHDESVRAEERARLGASTTHTERDMGLSDGHSESYRAGWRMGVAVGREDERERIARNIEAADSRHVLNQALLPRMQAARIAREGA